GCAWENAAQHSSTMKFAEKPYKSLVADPVARRVHIVDQTLLPFAVEHRALANWQEVAEAILTMRVRGAPLIGVTAAFGVALAMHEDATDASLAKCLRALEATRPTAVNLAWALVRMASLLQPADPAERADLSWAEAERIRQEDIDINRRIGAHALELISGLHLKHQRPVNVLTHCNAGRMACVDWGTATSPLYLAQQAGIPIHVWVEETRPRNQGLITRWELADAGINCTYLADNAGGHLMQNGDVDLVFVGVDRVARNGDVANKIGTYLKALAAHDCGIPFYAFAPRSSIDVGLDVGVGVIPIESRSGDEVRLVRGMHRDGTIEEIRLLTPDAAVTNPGFDVTPARLVTGLVTEDGIFAPSALAATLVSASQ
ncbi:MAG: S-methyl-5-thioribose-1-phosphate isomerase, partial [Burkholderiales bacterium]